MLISTRAGGLGLNLATATTVVMLDQYDALSLSLSSDSVRTADRATGIGTHRSAYKPKHALTASARRNRSRSTSSVHRAPSRLR